MADPQFKKEDVWAVARALGYGLYVDDLGRNAYLKCQHCRASTYYDWETEIEDRKSFKHKPHCVVLIARDLLTGATS